MANGYIVRDGAIVAVVHGYVGTPAQGDSFVECEQPTRNAGESLVRFVPVHVVRERLESAGKWSDITEVLFQPENKSLLLKLLTLRDGIYPDDQNAIDMINSIDEDPEVILAPVA